MKSSKKNQDKGWKHDKFNRIVKKGGKTEIFRGKNREKNLASNSKFTIFHEGMDGVWTYFDYYDSTKLPIRWLRKDLIKTLSDQYRVDF